MVSRYKGSLHMVVEVPQGSGVLYIAPVAGVGDRIISFLQGDRVDGVRIQILTMDGDEVTESFQPDPHTGFDVGLRPRYTLIFPEGLMPDVLATLSGPDWGWAFYVYRSLLADGKGGDEIKRMMPDHAALDTHCRYCGQEMANTNLHELLCPESPGGKGFHSS